MTRESTGPILTAIFVDYDNVYLSLKRKNEDAAKRFSKDAGLWIREIETGGLISPTNTPEISGPRRIVLNRCYGNPVPRRNTSDNSTDMSSFPFVRHHFLRAGCEVIDCPPLTAQLKNSADIRMVMDIRDLLSHDTYFDEFIILSGDADFTPVLHRLRSHARRTVIYANDNTAAPYTAICDGEVRETSFLALLRQDRLQAKSEPGQISEQPALASAATIEATRKQIMNEVVSTVRAAGQPVPLEALADRAVRILGHDKTVGSGWGGVGSFRDLIAKGLPAEIRLSDQPPYYAFDASRAPLGETKPAESRSLETFRAELPRQGPTESQPRQTLAPLLGNTPSAQRPAAPPHGHPSQAEPRPLAPAQPEALSGQPGHPPSSGQPRAQQQSRPSSPPPGEGATEIQKSIARIHEACQAPTLSPPDYRVLFDVMAQEISANGLAGSQTLANIIKRAQDLKIEIRHDDARFVLDVVSEADPWFDQGASGSLFASRFRNFVVARCRSQGLNLSAGELDLIEAWFAGPAASQRSAPAPANRPGQGQAPAPGKAPAPHQPGPAAEASAEARSDQSWSQIESRQRTADPSAPDNGDVEEFPRIIRTRVRG
ncbi:MAG: NYN domain-containing protein [Hyphomicrobium sp.]